MAGKRHGKHASTTADGDAFRDLVAELLRASGFAAQTETLEGHKRVDLFFEEVRFGKKRRYAIETKKWTRPLNHTDLERIFGGYASLLQTQAVHELIVVSPHELTSPAAKAFVRDTSGLTHQSFNQFQESILGFQQYLTAFVHRHENGGLERYFVPPSLTDRSSLLENILNWLQKEGSNPIAIIAGYGMGKTSFAEHLTFGLARRFLSGEPSRVPILVSLGAISKEQSLEGLISTVLAGSTPAVQNYSFPIFHELNTLGRFLIILDGFDEMKHMMTEADFRANFDELNRLVCGRAKVLLLGRPTAFLSDQERSIVLRGSRRIGSQWHQAQGAPHYQELSLAPFSPNQVRAFLTGYFKFRATGVDATVIAKRQEELAAPEHESLISRPVHARMLADLAADPNFELKGLTRFALYEHFIGHLIDREVSKPGRGSLLKREDRRAFASELAWHLWTSGGGYSLGCRVEDLPDSLFEPYEVVGEDQPTIRRALLSGSFLDEKKGGVFFFAHRSFQEFLVAEYIWDRLVSGTDDQDSILAILANSLTQEVFDFLVERDDAIFFGSFLNALTSYHRGMPFLAFLILMQSSLLRAIASSHSSATISSWDAGLMIADAVTKWEEEPNEILHAALAVSVKARQKPTVILAAIKTLILIGGGFELPMNVTGRAIVMMLFARPQEDIKALAKKRTRRVKADPLSDAIFASVSAKTMADGRLEMRLDISELFDYAAQAAVHPIEALAEDVLEERAIYEAEFSEFFEPINDNHHETLRQFFERDAQTAQIME